MFQGIFGVMGCMGMFWTVGSDEAEFFRSWIGVWFGLAVLLYANKYEAVAPNFKGFHYILSP
jgi:hypothetical protein